MVGLWRAEKERSEGMGNGELERGVDGLVCPDGSWGACWSRESLRRRGEVEQKHGAAQTSVLGMRYRYRSGMRIQRGAGDATDCCTE